MHLRAALARAGAHMTDEIEWGEWVDGFAVEATYLDRSKDYMVRRIAGKWQHCLRKPKVEKVEIFLGADGSGFVSFWKMEDTTHRITLKMIDGVMQPTAKVEPL